MGPDHRRFNHAQGDEDFAGFYKASYQRLLGQLFAVTGDLAEAENVLQEAYARAFARWAQVRAYDLPEAWVRRVALNLAAMAARRLRRRAAALLRLGPPPAIPELSSELLDLHDALRGLPLGQRQVVVLHHLVGLPVEEVAGELGVPAGTVKSRLARGRRALAQALETDRPEVAQG
ncbi:MAG TPA: SigE family RNA polymerase sigma factor [Actinomycetota bacterium]|nr:SigE family RNA polymerase sigma factor [Actinomycetota bacterium]